MLSTLEAFTKKDTHRVIGLMSGTSVDGIDAALCEISGHGRGNFSVKILGSYEQCFEPRLRARILDACKPGGGTSAELCELNFVLGEEFAHAARNSVQAAAVEISSVDLIGSHGQTVAHRPPGAGAVTDGIRRGSTLQIGCAAVIAERTGIPVISNFRPRDMAAGGQGAPLVPFADYLLFSNDTIHRAALNIGGIANVTWMPAGCAADDVIAFDTGPGNMIVDALAAQISDGKVNCDKDGTMAAAGTVDLEWIKKLLSHPYFQRALPKSTGREEFGAEFARDFFEQGRQRNLSPLDIVATATSFTADSIALNLNVLTACFPAQNMELLVAGGGVLNPTLMRMLRDALPNWQIDLTERFGIPAKLRECVAFAILARETMLGRPSNVPGVTGARGPRVLGEITF